MRRRKRIALGTFLLSVGAILLAPSATILYFGYFASRGRVTLDHPWLDKPLFVIVGLGMALILSGIYVISRRPRPRYSPRP